MQTDTGLASFGLLLTEDEDYFLRVSITQDLESYLEEAVCRTEGHRPNDFFLPAEGSIRNAAGGEMDSASLMLWRLHINGK